MSVNQLARTAAKWMLPAGFAGILRKIRSSPITTTSNAPPISRMLSLNSNTRFNAIHSGRRCFILATGPSIKEQNLVGLEGELCIAVSHFFLHPAINVIRPNYHVVAPYHSPFDYVAAHKLFDGLQQAYADIRPVCFLGYRPYEFSTYDFLTCHPKLVDLDVRHIDYSASCELDETNVGLSTTWDICGSPFAPRTVVYIAIQLAAYMDAPQSTCWVAIMTT